MDEPYKDPSQLTDEELDAAVNEEVFGTPKQDPPDDPKDPPAPSQDPPEDPKDPPTDPKEDPKPAPAEPKDPPADPPADPQDPKPAEEDPKDPPAPSPREARRIQALIAKMKNGQPAAPVAQPEPTPPAEVKPINFRELIDAPDEVYATLEKAAEDYGKGFQQPAPQAQQPQAQNVDPIESLRWEMKLENDTPRVLAKYEQLNPESEKFDPIVSDALNMEYLNIVGYDPATKSVQNSTISYSEYVDARFELANLLAKEQVQTSTKNVVKQAATTGLRPDGSQSKRLNLNQRPEDMTDEELDAVIAMGIPSN